MTKERILVVEDAPDISSLLRIYFTSQGYEVMTAMRGQVALDICRKTPPHLALLDVMLPDMEGYDIGKALRASPRTRHIPIIFLTARGERADRLKGLGEVQAQAYIIKPFDIEEVHIIVKNQLEEARRKNQSHPVTNLPTAGIISDHLRNLISTEGWSVALLHINGFETFTQAYGGTVGEDVLKFTALLLTDALNEHGSAEDFLGHMIVGPEFMLTSTPDRMQQLLDRILTRFDEEIGLHYNFKHREQGYIEVTDDTGSQRKLPLMSLSAGVLSSQDGPFYDIRELGEILEEVRLRAAAEAREQSRKSYAHYGRS